MNDKKSTFVTIEWKDGKVVMLDQRLLPSQEIYNRYHDVEGVAEAIRTMVIRGAPAIGVAAAFGVALAATEAKGDAATVISRVEEACDLLARTRPTAVNLFWAIDRMRRCLAQVTGESKEKIQETLLAEAEEICAEDLSLCLRIGEFGAPLVPEGATILTHCNAGALATAGHGTALGVIRSAAWSGKNIRVLADETRPFLQGARLTAWELNRDGIDVTVLADVAAASLMARGKVDLVIVGTDRVAANGDVANKIGTYSVALAARANKIPFYVAAPWSTIDMNTPDGASIPIEDRPSREVTHIGDHRIVPQGVPVLNPAFDITPADLVTALITDRGVIRAPYPAEIEKLSRRGS